MFFGSVRIPNQMVDENIPTSSRVYFSEKWIQYSKENLLPKEFKNLENQILQNKSNHGKIQALNRNELIKKNNNLENEVKMLENKIIKLKISYKKFEKFIEKRDLYLIVSSLIILFFTLVVGYIYW